MTACAEAETDPEPTTRASSYGAASEVEPPQPFDIVLGEELGLIEFVQMRLQHRCLADAGYVQNLEQSGELRPTDVTIDLRISLRDFGLRSEDEARRKGFGSDHPGEPARVVSFDPSYEANLERCSREAWDRLDDEAETAYAAYSDLINQLLPYRAEVDAEVPSDQPVRMYDCMVGNGYQVDRDAFLASPSYTTFGVPMGSLEPAPARDWAPEEEPGTVQVGPAIPPRRYTPTQEESALAVAWVQCLDETGVAQERLDVALDLQQRYVDRYESQIVALNEQLEPLARAAAGLLAEVQ